MSHTASVYLVGAGPGDPGYLTLRGAECLALADLVLYDQLVSLRLLDHAPEAAEKVCITAFADAHPDRWPHVHDAMIQAARQGKTVVRLKGGDPLVFGRGAEEAEALRKAKISYEIVPGVTAALGAAACTEIPLTHRDHASAVAFVTGHENPAKPETVIDWANLARFPGTLVIYMGMARLPQIVDTLLKHGKPVQTAAAVIHNATTGNQRVTTAPLGELAEAVRSSQLGPPALVFIGSVARLARTPSWFEARPLFRRQVLICRPERQGREFARRVELLGATPILVPAVEIREPPHWGPVDKAISELPTFDWLVFTSSNGVRSLFQRLFCSGRDLRLLGRCRLAAIGPGTAQALREFHLHADVVPGTHRSEELAAALRTLVAGKRILLARADRGRELLYEELSAVANVVQVAVYSQVDAKLEPGKRLECVRNGLIDYIPLTSSNIARSLLGGLDEACRAQLKNGKTRIVSISPVTTAAIRNLGFDVASEARTYTTDGLIEAMIELARPEPRSP